MVKMWCSLYTQKKTTHRHIQVVNAIWGFLLEDFETVDISSAIQPEKSLK